MPTPQKERPRGTKGNGTSNGEAVPDVIRRIRSIGYGEDDGIKMMLYGASGTGKTTLWGTFPKKILAIICSAGIKGSETRSLDTPEYRELIDEVQLHETGELKDLIKYLKKGSPYKTVVLDHASGFSDMVLKEILGIEELPAQKSWGMATREQYGQATLQCKEFFKPLLDLQQNVVIIAHEREFNTEGLEGIVTPTIGASMTPNLSKWLHGAVDYCGQMFKRVKVVKKKVTKIIKGKSVEKVIEVPTDEIEYCMRTGADLVFETKFRVHKSHKPPKFIVDPDYDKIAAVLRNLRQESSEFSKEQLSGKKNA